MKKPGAPHPAWSAVIVAFCLWHMTAITLYNVENGGLVVKAVRRITDPYILLLSQWQRWDVFSPYPMRRVATFVVERNAGDRWETAMVMSYRTLPWHLRVKEMKILDRIAGNWKGMTESYLLSLCPLIPYSAERDIKLTMRYYVLPDDLPTLRVMSTKRFFETSELLGTVRCPRRNS